MRTSTTQGLRDEEIVEHLGIVKGNTVRARNAGMDLIQNLKNFIGGELKGYSDLMTGAREEALERMEQEAEELGADAVVNVRFVTSQVTKGGSEILAYGTAVKLE